MSIESSRSYRASHLEEVREKDRIRGRARWLRNPGAMIETNRQSRRKLRLETIAAYGGLCSCCGESHQEFLAIDHINGGGTAQRRALGFRGSEFHRWLRALGYPKDECRLLCHNCNQSRGWYGYCPHEKARA